MLESAYMTEVTPRSTSAMVREPTTIHSGDDSGSSSITEQKMPDLSETKLVRKNNSMSAVPAHSSSSGDEGPHEDMEDKPLDSAGEEVGFNQYTYI